MVKNRRANAVLFGFDFQRNAAIILMLERIKELRSVRLEGNEEDIELTLENGKKILAQAKAVEKSSSDFSHVRENLKKALISLSEGAQRVDAQELIFITNSPNPFNDEASRSVFGGLPTHRSFSSLPPSAQVTVQKYLGNIENPLDSEKFTVQVFPFETDNEAERYKAVTQAMNDFIGSLNVNVSYGLGKWLLQVWQELLCRGWFLPPNTYDCGSFVVNGTAVVGKELKHSITAGNQHTKELTFMKSLFEQMGGTYRQVGDYLIPNLSLPEKSDYQIGKYGRLRRNYLKEYHPVLYANFLTSGTLHRHLAEIDQACNERMEIIISDMAKQDGVTETLKVADQMEWVRRMNSIRSRAEEIVLTELVYE